MSEIQVGQINSTDGSTAITTGADGYVSFAKTQIGGRRNWFINSDFQVSQRGDYTSASSVTNGNYWVDRFVSLFSTVTTQYQHQYSQTINADTTANTIKVTATSSGTGFIGHQQSIENVNNQLGNKPITISVWVKSNNVNTRLRGIFDGTGWTEYAGAVHTGDGTWQKLTATFTTGATRTGHYSLQFITYNGGSVSVASGDYIEIAQPQVEIGSVATPFEHRSYGEELALCQRYYFKHTVSQANDSFCVGMMEAPANSCFGDVKFAVPMRSDPTALETTGTATDYEIRVPGATVVCNAIPTIIRASVYSSLVKFAISSTETSNTGQMRAATTNGYLAWSAEL